MTTNQQIRTMGFVVLFLGFAGVLFTMINIPVIPRPNETLVMFERARQSYQAVWAWSTVVCFMGFGVIYIGKEN